MLADTFRQIAAARWTDKNGRARQVGLMPPATADEIRAIEAAVPAPLPEGIRGALEVTKGLADGPLESFSLVDLEGFGLEELFPHAYSIAHDGCGNYWLLDLLPDSSEWGPVFYACHDPPVIAYQADTIEQFLCDILAMWQPGSSSPVDVVHDEAVHRLWREDVDLMTPLEASQSGDPVLAGFAATLPAAARIADLRQAGLGQGFAWGRHGRSTILQRAGLDRIWAIARQERRPGLLRRIFGGS